MAMHSNPLVHFATYGRFLGDVKKMQSKSLWICERYRVLDVAFQIVTLNTDCSQLSVEMTVILIRKKTSLIFVVPIPMNPMKMGGCILCFQR